MRNKIFVLAAMLFLLVVGLAPVPTVLAQDGSQETPVPTVTPVPVETPEKQMGIIPLNWSGQGRDICAGSRAQLDAWDEAAAKTGATGASVTSISGLMARGKCIFTFVFSNGFSTTVEKPIPASVPAIAIATPPPQAQPATNGNNGLVLGIALALLLLAGIVVLSRRSRSNGGTARSRTA